MNRRGLLTANALKKGGYVTDGLILHLDGIDYGGQEGKWIDLINGDEFIVDGNVSRGENCFTFVDGSVSRNQSYNIVQAEFVIKYKNYSDKKILTTNNARKSAVIWNNTTLQIPAMGVYGRSFSLSSYMGKITQISSDFVNIYINATKQVTGSAPNNDATTYNGTLIGRKPDNTNPYVGDIHSIRFYNRTLTAEEIAQNFTVDKVRFSIPD